MTPRPNFLICPDEPRVLLRRKHSQGFQLIVGYMRIETLIRAAAARGRAQIAAGERCTNF